MITGRDEPSHGQNKHHHGSTRWIKERPLAQGERIGSVGDDGDDERDPDGPILLLELDVVVDDEDQAAGHDDRCQDDKQDPETKEGTVTVCHCRFLFVVGVVAS